MSMRNKIIIGCMLLGALSVGAQEKPVTAADYKQKVLEYSRQIKQSAEERIAMQHAIKAAKTAFFPAVDFSGSYQYRINKYDLDFGPGMAVDMDHTTYSLGAMVRTELPMRISVTQSGRRSVLVVLVCFVSVIGSPFAASSVALIVPAFPVRFPFGSCCP